MSTSSTGAPEISSEELARQELESRVLASVGLDGRFIPEFWDLAKVLSRFPDRAEEFIAVQNYANRDRDDDMHEYFRDVTLYRETADGDGYDEQGYTATELLTAIEFIHAFRAYGWDRSRRLQFNPNPQVMLWVLTSYTNRKPDNEKSELDMMFDAMFEVMDVKHEEIRLVSYQLRAMVRASALAEQVGDLLMQSGDLSREREAILDSSHAMAHRHYNPQNEGLGNEEQKLEQPLGRGTSWEQEDEGEPEEPLIEKPTKKQSRPWKLKKAHDNKRTRKRTRGPKR